MDSWDISPKYRTYFFFFFPWNIELIKVKRNYLDQWFSILYAN